MLWKEIPNQDPSKTWLFYIQNFTKTPTAYVHLYITDGDPPAPDDDPQQTLIALQVLRIYVQPNFKVYFAEENGGVCTAIKTEKIPFVNYDVPTLHKNIPLIEEYRFTAPEGSEIVFQNFSGDGDCFINIGGGDGWIRATRFATIMDSFHDDTEIVIRGETGTEVISIIQKQSLAVTQLSDENLDLLEDLITRVELIEQNYITKPELDEVKKRTYYGIWSPYSTINKQTSNVIKTKTFKSAVEEYRSSLYDNGKILNVVNNVKMIYHENGEDKTENAYLSFDVLLTDQKEDKFLNIHTDNVYIKTHLKNIKINRNLTNDELNFEFKFEENLEFIEVSTTIRSEEIVSNIVDTPMNINHTINYNIDLCNGDIIFTDYNFFLNLMEPHEILFLPPNRLSRYAIDRGATMVDTQLEDNYSVHLIRDGLCNIKYYEPFETLNIYKPKIEIEFEKNSIIKSVIGFMLIPYDEYLDQIPAITVNIAACLAEKQTISSAGNLTKVVNVLHISPLQKLDYLNIYKSITLDILNKSQLFLIIQRVGD